MTNSNTPKGKNIMRNFILFATSVLALSVFADKTATQQWVLDKNYVTKEVTNGLATVSYVDAHTPGNYAEVSNRAMTAIQDISGKQDKLPYPTNAVPYSVLSGTPDLSDMATKTWVDDHEFVDQTITNGLATKTYVDQHAPGDYETVSNKAMSALQSSDIIDVVTSTATDKSLSANMGKELQDQIDNLKQRGRFLSVWNSATGLATTSPTVNPYSYKTGDYFVIGIVTNTTNYKPSGAQYTGVASTVAETATVNVNDTYYYDGTSWMLLATEQKSVTFGSITGDISANTALKSAFDGTNSYRRTDVSIPWADISDSPALVGHKDSASDYFFADADGIAISNETGIVTMGVGDFCGFGGTGTPVMFYCEEFSGFGAPFYFHTTSYQSYLTPDDTPVATSNMVNRMITPATNATLVAAKADAAAKYLSLAGGTITGSLAQGSGCEAGGDYSHAEGELTTASGGWSHAEGYKAKASGDWSHAEGELTTASGDYSQAEGSCTTASGECSHAEGDQTIASGDWSHAEGYKAKASGDYSFAWNGDDDVKSYTSHGEGTFNISPVGGLAGFYIGETNFAQHISNLAPKYVPSHIDTTFSNEVLAVVVTATNSTLQAAKDYTDVISSLYFPKNGSENFSGDEFKVRNDSGDFQIKIYEPTGENTLSQLMFMPSTKVWVFNTENGISWLNSDNSQIVTSNMMERVLTNSVASAAKELTKATNAVYQASKKYTDDTVVAAIGMTPEMVTNTAEFVSKKNLPFTMTNATASVVSITDDHMVLQVNITGATTINFMPTQASTSTKGRVIEVYMHCDLTTIPSVTWSKAGHTFLMPEWMDGETLSPVTGDKIIYFNEISPNKWMVQPCKLISL